MKGQKYGTGEFEKQDQQGNSDSRSHLRSKFLKIAADLKPEILQELETILLPIYQQIPLICYTADPTRRRKRFKSDMNRRLEVTDWSIHSRPNWYQIEKAWANPRAKNRFKHRLDDDLARTEISEASMLLMNDLVKGMWDWSKRHYLDAVWCRHHAFETLDLWTIQDDYRALKIWQFLPWDLRNNTVEMKSMNPQPSKFDTKIEFDLADEHFKQLTFYPTYGGRDAIMTSLRDLKMRVELLTKTTNDFLDHREQSAIAEGFVPALRKENLDHIIWFAKVQILNVSYLELADAFYSVEETTLGRKLTLDSRT
jgi:hypothetical protein